MNYKLKAIPFEIIDEIISKIDDVAEAYRIAVVLNRNYLCRKLLPIVQHSRPNLFQDFQNNADIIKIDKFDCGWRWQYFFHDLTLEEIEKLDDFYYEKELSGIEDRKYCIKNKKKRISKAQFYTNNSIWPETNSYRVEVYLFCRRISHQEQYQYNGDIRKYMNYIAKSDKLLYNREFKY